MYEPKNRITRFINAADADPGHRADPDLSAYDYEVARIVLEENRRLLRRVRECLAESRRLGLLPAGGTATSSPAEGEDDPLAFFRGTFVGIMLSAGLWAVVALILRWIR